MSYTISLLPLSADLHTAALQEVYEATPGYWAMYHLLAPPADQAERDLAEAVATPGRTMMGIVKPVERGNAAAGAELIGLVDFRLHWPADQTASLGMIMVAVRVLSRRCLVCGRGVRRFRMTACHKQHQRDKARDEDQ